LQWRIQWLHESRPLGRPETPRPRRGRVRLGGPCSVGADPGYPLGAGRAVLDEAPGVRGTAQGPGYITVIAPNSTKAQAARYPIPLEMILAVEMTFWATLSVLAAVIRDLGSETLMAATTSPAWSRTGAATHVKPSYSSS